MARTKRKKGENYHGSRNGKRKAEVISSDSEQDPIEIFSSSEEDSDHETRSSKRARLNNQKKRDGHVEEDFISLDTDTRNRAQRRYDELYGSKLKRHQSDSDDEETIKKNQNNYPWMALMEYDHTDKPLSAHAHLQQEVMCFLDYIEPTQAEIRLREYLVHRITEAVSKRWPGSSVEVFGSFRTNIFLPSSDIDMVAIIPGYEKPSLYQLGGVLERADICQNPQIITRATVPVIKFEDTLSRIKVDLIINSTSGVASAEEINRMADAQPALRPLSLIMKYYMAHRGLNEVFTGGLGGYAIVCLVMSFLQMHPKVATKSIDPLRNLGVLMLDMFQLYGINFNIDNVCIDVTGKGSYRSKKKMVSRNGNSVYSILDPLDASNDIGNKSYNAFLAIRAFKFAYLSMVRKGNLLEDELNKRKYKDFSPSTIKNPKRASILGTFLFMTKEMLSHRVLLNNVYIERRWEGQPAARTFPWKVSEGGDIEDDEED
ncbi:Nucleotidyltransferase [Backusella circina FSU 941]|nr:Nucleotidyltransferase [Backusella circina FSU 941]